MTPVIAGRGLTRAYGSFLAVRGIDFEVASGECFGFLGPNGAGKTSTIRMLACRLPITGGTLSILELDAMLDSARIRERIGVVPQDNNLDPDLTVQENLLIYAQFFGLSAAEARRRTEQQLEFMDLTEKKKARLEELSGGMRRRLVLARALLNDPELVILDEPTTGLDPHARLMVWERLRALRDRGVTLVLTTHYMDEAWRLCDRLVVMDRGRIIADGSPRAMVGEHAGRWAVELPLPEGGGEPDQFLAPCAGVSRRWQTVGSRLYLYGEDEQALLERLREAGRLPGGYLTRPADLEDVFLLLTGRTLQDSAAEEKEAAER